MSIGPGRANFVRLFTRLFTYSFRAALQKLHSAQSSCGIHLHSPVKCHECPCPALDHPCCPLARALLFFSCFRTTQPTLHRPHLYTGHSSTITPSLRTSIPPLGSLAFLPWSGVVSACPKGWKCTCLLDAPTILQKGHVSAAVGFPASDCPGIELRNIPCRVLMYVPHTCHACQLPPPQGFLEGTCIPLPVYPLITQMA
jgi:hypothetical protein